MANKTFEQLPSASEVNAGDIVPIQQGGITKKVDIALLGSPTIQIPEPIIKTGAMNSVTKHSDCSVTYYSNGSNEWLNHTPMLFLFRLKKKTSKKDSNDNRIKVPERWAHPTPITSRGFSIYNDFSKIYEGGDIKATSEWLVPPSFKPHEKLPNFTFNPIEFFKAGGVSIDSTVFPYCITDDLGHHNYMWLKPTDNSNRTNKYSRVTFFRFCFVIRDPKVEGRIIFGPMSNIIRAYTTYYSSLENNTTKKYCKGISLDSKWFPVKRMHEKFVYGY